MGFLIVVGAGAAVVAAGAADLWTLVGRWCWQGWLWCWRTADSGCNMSLDRALK